MNTLRGLIALIVCMSLCIFPTVLPAGGSPPLGILTRAFEAYLNTAEAYPGLSVFEGEELSTTAEGRLSVRVGSGSISLSQNAKAVLQKVVEGTHVDLHAGAVYLASPTNTMIEVHAADALFRPEAGRLTQAEVVVLGPKVLQVSAKRGNLEFSYQTEYELIPEGETYRIYLDAPGEPQRPAGAGAPAVGINHKVAIYIVAGIVATGGAAWGLHELLQSNGGIESPAKP